MSMAIPALLCILMLAGYLLAFSIDDDEYELALSLLALGQVLSLREIRARRSRLRGEYWTGRTRAHCDQLMHQESRKVFKSWLRYVLIYGVKLCIFNAFAVLIASCLSIY